MNSRDGEGDEGEGEGDDARDRLTPSSPFYRSDNGTRDAEFSGLAVSTPDQTDEAIYDGYFHTGDLAVWDEFENVHIVDRKKDMFISGGENVYPAEIEAVLYQHSAVHMCAVLGVPHAKWGEVGKACVVLKPGTSVTEGELIEFMQNHLARFKVPKSVELLTELPISGAGKILKRELRNRFVD